MVGSRLTSRVVSSAIAVLCAGLWLAPPVEGQAPHTIEVFGHQFPEVDLVWVLDTSISMSWGTPAPLEVMKAEATAGIAQLEPTQHFNVILFANSTTEFSATTVPATQVNRDLAIAMINAVSMVDGQSCMGSAIVAAFEDLSTSPSSDDSAVLVFTDGAPNCPGGSIELDYVVNSNIDAVPVHAIWLGVFAGSMSFLEQLSDMTGGTFVDPAAPVSFFRRGDANDDGSIDLLDMITILGVLFHGRAVPCPESADTDDDAALSLTDVVFLGEYLFNGGLLPPAPGPAFCGTATATGLGPCSMVSCP